MAVRNEVVRLSLDDNFSAGMAQAAAATALFNRRLTTLNTRLNTVGNNTNRDAAGLFGPVVSGLNQVPPATRRADSSINQLSGRLSLLAKVAASVGPALVPIGAAALPAIAGLANQLGAAALAGGTAILAFQGVGDALTAMNKAQLEPTAATLEAARVAMENLSPAAGNFVVQLQNMQPALQGLRDSAAEGLFPGLSDSLDEIETRFPDVERIFTNIGAVTGDLATDLAENLSASRFDGFFDFLATDMPSTLDSLGRTVGNLAEGMAELWMAMDPASDDFTSGLLEASQAFSEWAGNLSQTEGFQDFLAYIRENGPRVVDALASIGNAAVQIVAAMGTVGEGSLMGITAFADAAAAIAASDFGTPIAIAAAALSALNIAMGAYASVAASALVSNTISYFGTGLVGAMNAAATAATALGVAMGVALPVGVALFVGHLDDANLSAQQMRDGLQSLATGGSADVFDNLTFGAESLGEALHNAAFDDLSGLFGSADEIEQMDRELAKFATQDAPAAAAAFDRIQSVAENQGVSLDRLLELFPAYRAQLQEMGALDPTDWLGGIREGFEGVAQGIETAMSDSVPARSRAVAEAIAGIGAEALTAAGSAQALSAALDALLSPQLNLSQATDAFEGSLRGLNDSLAEQTRSLQGFGEGALQNREVIRGLATDLQGIMVAQAEAGAGPRELARSLESGRAKIMQFGEAAGIGRAQLREFLAQIGLTPALVRTVLKAQGMKEAAADARTVREEFASLPKDVRTRIKADGIPQTKKDLDDLDKAVGGLTKKQRRIIVDLMDAAARGKVKTLEGLLKHLDAQKPTPKADVDAGAAHRGLNDVTAHVHQVDQQRASPTVTANVGSALSGINAVLSAMSRIQNKSVTITTFHRDVGRQGIGDQNADGGLYENGVRTFASGGYHWPRIGDQQSQLRPYTGPRGLTWSEEGSGPWEAFISGHPSKQLRSRTIADDVVRRLGGEVMWRAADGLLLERRMRTNAPAPVINVSAPAGGGRQVNINGQIVTTDINALARAIDQRERDAVALMGAA